MTASTQHDVVVVGGRVAGALTAAYLARQGMSVLVLESGSFPSDTLSTHFFRGDGLVRCLADLDLLDPVLALGAPQLTCQYSHEAGGIERGDAQEPGSAGFGLSVRRAALDALVASKVSSLAGVDFRTGTRVTELLFEDGVVVGVLDDQGARHEAPLVVGADGRRSAVAKRVDAGFQERHPAARVMHYRYVTGWRNPEGALDGPEFSMLDNEMFYVFPSDGDTACIALTAGLADTEGDPAAYFDTRLRAHAGLWPRFEQCTQVGGLFSNTPAESVIRTAAGPGWALVGDAGTHQDPWTGYGMDTAARQAEALSAAVTGGGDWAAAYAKARDDATLDRFTMTVSGAPDFRQFG